MKEADRVCFEERVMAVLDGTASEAERAEFGLLLERNPEYVAEYMRQARMHVLLEACAGLRGRQDGGRRTGDRGRWPRVHAGRWWKVAAAAAVLLVGLAVWRLSPPAASGSPVATVLSSRHGQWADGREVADGTVLHAGVWAWQGGLVELVTRSDTVLVVEAPASLEIIDAMHARLLSGKLVVRMPKGRSGFVVDTPDLHVQDLGTEFGVSVSPAGEARVQVFEGKVRAETADRAVRKEVRAGETVRIKEGGELVAADYEERRFIRRMPPVDSRNMKGGVLYSKSAVETLRVAYAAKAVIPDGDLSEWSRERAFRSACQPPFAETYFLEGMMMYDAQNLYLAAHVGDPEPMCNTAPEGFEFAGGSVIVRISTDPLLGWPLKGTLLAAGPKEYRKRPPTPEAASDRIASLIMWHDARAGRARLRLQRGIDLHGEHVVADGWQGVFRKDPDGRGYTLEYVIPWRLLNCADRPPRAGDTLAALWMVHWSDSEGRLARGQLVEVTNHQPHSGQEYQQHVYYQNGPSWGRAVYLPKGE